ncbi:MAG: DUF4058 family protein [Anaerolineales bacterium]
MSRSPVPGMDPYLEGEMWSEFQATFASALSKQLLLKTKPKYVALLNKRLALDQPTLGIAGVSAIYPDVGVAHMLKEAATITYPATVTPPSAEVVSPLPEEVPLTTVEIRDVAERRLVTVIEILSPVNKRGDCSREYHNRRVRLLQTQTHLLEIDLLRGGHRFAVEGQLPPAPYYIYLSRFTQRPRTQVWGVQLRDRLPTVPVPLLPPDADVLLDLQSAVEACFELVEYDRLLDYTQTPPLPPLSDEETAWARDRIVQARHNASL